MLDIKRREFIALVGGASLLLAVKVKRAWGQQRRQMRRIGILMPYPKDDAESPTFALSGRNWQAWDGPAGMFNSTSVGRRAIWIW